MPLRSLIPCLPEQNHLRLVNEAYPRSKTAVEPDSNALGKLTFYTKSRPVKLAKVGRALLKRSQRSSEPDSHVCVTLTIIKKLLDECRKDVVVFADQAMAITQVGLDRAKRARHNTSANPSSLEIYERTAGAFYALVTFSEITIASEPSYFKLLEQFCTLARDDETMQMRIVGLHALEGVVASDLLYSAGARIQSDLVINTLLYDLIDGGLDRAILEGRAGSQEKSETTRPYGGDAASSPSRIPLHDRRARSIRAAKGLDGTEKPKTAMDAAQSAFKVLQTLYRSSTPRYIESSLFSLLRYFDDTRQPENGQRSVWEATEWCTALVGKITECVQAQYRFSVITFWLEQLEALQSPSPAAKSSRDAPSSSTAQHGSSDLVAAKNQTFLSILIHLLASPTTSVVNLAISDTLSTLSGLIIRNPDNQLLQQAILALASHIYYPEQINDMVGDLLMTVVELEEQASASTTPMSADPTNAMKVLLHCIREMVQSSSNKEKEIYSKGKGKSASKADLNLTGEQWQASLAALEDKDAAVRSAYLGTMNTLLLHSSAFAPRAPLSKRNSIASVDTTGAVPAITLAAASNTRLPLHLAETTRFAVDLHIRIYGLLQRFSDSTEAEQAAICDILDTVYQLDDPKVVLDGIPVLLACDRLSGSGSGSSAGLVGKIYSRVLPAVRSKWGVHSPEAPGSSSTSIPRTAQLSPAEIIEALACSTLLQRASSLSASEIASKLSQPFSHSPTTANTTLGLAYSPKKAYSIRNSADHGQLGAGPANSSNGHGRLSSRPGSMYTTSLADLKHSLGAGSTSPTSPQGGRHSTYAGSSVQPSPPRSTVNSVTQNNSVASSINNLDHHQQNGNGRGSPPSHSSPVISPTSTVPTTNSHGHPNSAIPTYLLQEKGAILPPAAITPHHGGPGHSHPSTSGPKSLSLSPTKSVASSSSGGGRSRLDRIIGSIDDDTTFGAAGTSPQRMTSLQPPYQLS